MKHNDQTAPHSQLSASHSKNSPLLAEPSPSSRALGCCQSTQRHLSGGDAPATVSASTPILLTINRRGGGF